MPDLTVQLNHILPELERKAVLNKKSAKSPLLLTKKVNIPSQSQALLERLLSKQTQHYRSFNELALLSSQLRDTSSNLLNSSLSTAHQNGKLFVHGRNFSENEITLNIQTEPAQFEYLNYKSRKASLTLTCK